MDSIIINIFTILANSPISIALTNNNQHAPTTTFRG